MFSLKNKEKWKEHLPLIGAFLIPLIVCVIICIRNGVYPFGDRCILHIDMYHQYCPFFTEFQHKLHTGGSLQYSWNIGLGADFTSLYAYYLASPLNWLLLLWPKNYVIEFMTVMILIKIALSGWTFGYYLKKHFQTCHPIICVFATAYALCAFMAAYSWDIMWTDCMVLAPLIVLGLEQLVYQKKATLYYVTLALSILANYYISILICIFLVMYFVILWLEMPKKPGQKKGKQYAKERLEPCFRFAGYSILAGGTGALLWIPEAVILSYSGSQKINFPDTMEWYFNIVAELARHCVNTEVYTASDHWPNIYCGTFVFLFVILFALNKKIPLKKKIARLILVAIFVVAFANNMLDFIWHGLHFPDSLPARQTFLYAFVLLTISCEAFLQLQGNKVIHIVIAFFLSVGFLLLAYNIGDKELVTIQNFMYTELLMGVYALLLIFYLAGTWQNGIVAIAGVIAVCELAVNMYHTGLDTTSRTSYTAALSDYEVMLNQVEELEENASDIHFYRVEKIERKTKNDAPLSGYRSATQFSSVMNFSVSEFYDAMGMEDGKNFYCVNGAGPLISSMLSIKYIIADNDREANSSRSMVARSGDNYMYENIYSLPLGYMISDDVMHNLNLDEGDGIQNQNELAMLLGATEDLYIPVPSVSEAGASTISVTESGFYFAAHEDIDEGSLTEEVSDGRTRDFNKTDHNYTLDLGYCEAGSTITIRNTAGIVVPITAYRLNTGSMAAAYNTLSEQTMELTKFEDTRVEGTIDVVKPGYLVFSITSEPGWSTYVDGEQVDAEAFGGAFIAIPLEEGTHDISLRYRTPQLMASMAVSASCIIVFVLVSVVTRTPSKKETEKQTKKKTSKSK